MSSVLWLGRSEEEVRRVDQLRGRAAVHRLWASQRRSCGLDAAEADAQLADALAELSLVFGDVEVTPQAVLAGARAVRLVLDAGTVGMPHTGRTLFDHLCGTWWLLSAWHAPQDWCLAGLCHTLYGTEAYRACALGQDARPRVRDAIGGAAEKLVWAFARHDREAFFSNRLVQDDEARPLDSEHAAMANLHLANALEQRAAAGGRPEVTSWRRFGSDDLLPAAAAAHARLVSGHSPFSVAADDLGGPYLTRGRRGSPGGGQSP